MDAAVDLEKAYKELEAKNQANITENLKAKVQLEETIKRLKSIVDSSEYSLDNPIDYDRLSDKTYVSEVIADIENTIAHLKTQFLDELDKARKELGE